MTETPVINIKKNVNPNIPVECKASIKKLCGYMASERNSIKLPNNGAHGRQSRSQTNC